MSSKILLVLSTFPDRGKAQRIAEELVAGRFAACANVASAVDSFFLVERRDRHASEVLVLFKTTTARFPAFSEKLKALHPHDLPEIIALPIAAGSDEYLAWVEENCR